MAIFAPAVEQWRSLVSKYGAPGGADFHLKWIEKESGGRPCAWTSLREAGPYQLMAGDNQRVAGTTEALLRAACVSGSSSQARELTAAEREELIRSGVAYVNWAINQARAKLKAAGANWSESSSDFGKMVKFQHVLPARTGPWLAAATAGLGRPPASWAELVPYAAAANIPANWVANADDVGAYWNGFGEIPVIVAALSVAALLVYYLRRRR